MTYRSAPSKRRELRFGFIRDTIAELKKVVWLTRRETAYLTVLVLIVSISMGIFLGLVDYGFTRLVNDIFLGG